MFIGAATKNTSFASPLESGSMMRPTQGRRKKNIVRDLLLTALVDSFSVLVIFLIMNASSSYNVEVDKGMILPMAEIGKEMVEAPVIKIKDGQYFIDDKEVAVGALAPQLIRLAQTLEDKAAKAEKEKGVLDKIADVGKVEKKDKSLIVLANKNMDYSALNPLMVAASVAGFTEFKFAVITK